MMIAGAGLALYFGSQAVVQNAAVVAIEQSGMSKVSGAMQYLGKWLPFLDVAGTYVDPRRTSEYINARGALAGDITAAAFGVLLIVGGLVGAGFRQTSSRSSTIASGLVAASAIAVMVLGTGATVTTPRLAYESAASTPNSALTVAPQLPPVPPIITSGQPQAPTATPAPPIIKGWTPSPSQVGPYKINPDASMPLTLRIPAYSRLTADVQLAFNSRLSVGSPSIAITVDGPDGVVHPRALVRSGYVLTFVADKGGEYRITLDNNQAMINAVQVGLSFR